MKQLLRRIDGWHFEGPLALLLAAAAAFVMMAMPDKQRLSVPVTGTMGDSGQVLLATLAALFAGIGGYVAMRSSGKPRRTAAPSFPISTNWLEAVDEEDEASETLHRLRRADAHPDAPPRAPIRASRDLGEPFMEVGQPIASHADPEPTVLDGDYVKIEAPAAGEQEAHPAQAEQGATETAHVEWEHREDEVQYAPEAFRDEIHDEVPAAEETVEAHHADPVHDDPWAAHFDELARREAEQAYDAGQAEPVSNMVEAKPVDHLADADYAHEQFLSEEQVTDAFEPVAKESVEAPKFETVTPIERGVPAEPVHPGRESLAAMMDRLSSGLERRAAAVPATVGGGADPIPSRDLRPSLRDALDELNKLATRRG